MCMVGQYKSVYIWVSESMYISSAMPIEKCSFIGDRIDWMPIGYIQGKRSMHGPTTREHLTPWWILSLNYSFPIYTLELIEKIWITYSLCFIIIYYLFFFFLALWRIISAFYWIYILWYYYVGEINCMRWENWQWYLLPLTLENFIYKNIGKKIFFIYLFMEKKVMYTFYL